MTTDLRHIVHIRETHFPHRWHVTCEDCDLEVRDLDTPESAIDTLNWHQGYPSAIGGDL